MTRHSIKDKGRWIALALAAALLAAWAFRPRPLAVDVAEVRLGRFEQAIQEDGRLRVKHRYVIAAPTAAELARPALKVGDRIEQGQVVALLTPVAPQMIDARTRGVLRQRVAGAEAARAAAQAHIGRAEAALAQATLEAQRADDLARDHFVSPAARDQAALALRLQQRTLDAARAEWQVAAHALDEARAALARADGGNGGAAAPRAGQWALRAPVAGHVIRLNQDVGGPVALGQALLEIADTTQLEAVIDVLSSDALRIRPGAAVRLAMGSGTPARAGRVWRVEPVAFTKVSALGIEEQRVNVIVDIDPRGEAVPALGEGFRVDADIVVSAQDEALIVPTAALVRDGGRWAVLVAEGGRARLRPVALRERNAEAAWVDAGVAVGERVVLYPGAAVGDGQRLRVNAPQ